MLKASKETSPLDYFGITNLQKRGRIHWCYIKATEFVAIYHSCDRILIYYNFCLPGSEYAIMY